MKYLLLIFSALLSTSLSAVEYGQLLPNESLYIEDGDLFEVIDFSGKHTPISATIANFTMEGDTQNSYSLEVINNTNHKINSIPKIVGPSNITVPSGGMYSVGWLMYKLTKASEVEYKNVNIVSLPSSSVGQGTHEIVVEASDDLQSWTPVHSSSIGGDKAFFRTRVVEVE